MSKRVRRLFDGFKPNNYELLLSLSPKTMTFSGTVTITGQKTGRPSQRLVFHQKGLKILSAKLTRQDKHGQESIEIKRLNQQNTFDELRLHSDKMLYPGQYLVTINFTGKISRAMNGIYPAYFEDNGQQQCLLATQFESHHAREAFPCIDEPEAKATFDLTITAPAKGSLIANTPIKSHTEKKGSQIVRFDTTPKMSTYLLAFVYGDLEYLEATTKTGTIVRSYATKDNVQHTSFALEVAVKLLDFYNEYYDLPYPLAKCDLVALPDFASGAMENWGCVTFREQALLVDPKNSSLPAKQYVALVVAHELAHQWFGNLVTMRWWTDLWLNEGFASWMEYLAVDHIFPEWKIWIEFIVSEQEAGLRLDALEHTHPIEVPINHPDEIRTIFDNISYAKGSSVLHMLNDYLGAADFQAGLRHYLKTHAYSNTDTIDLWSALENISHKPVKKFMEAWTAKAGFPVIHVGMTPKELALSQERFYLNPASTKQAESLWPIPLLPSQSINVDILEAKNRKLKINKLRPDFIINHDKAGFYRTTYDPAHVDEMAKSIKNSRFNILDRLSILSDAFETAKAGYSSTVLGLKLLAAFQNEDNTFVWDTIVGSLGSIRLAMNDENLREAMKPFGRKLAADQLARLGWQPKTRESHFDTLLRPTILGLASVSDNKTVIKEARDRFSNMKNSVDLPPDLRGVIYGTVARTGSKVEFDRLLKLHNGSKNSEERLVLTAALTSFKQPDLIRKALSQVTTDNVRMQDVAYWVAYSFMNHYGRDITWDWLVEHWDWLEKNLGNDLAFSRFPIYAARVYSDKAFLKTYQKYFAIHKSLALERSIKQGAEIIEWQSAWRERDLGVIKKFFEI